MNRDSRALPELVALLSIALAVAAVSFDAAAVLSGFLLGVLGVYPFARRAARSIRRRGGL